MSVFSFWVLLATKSNITRRHAAAIRKHPGNMIHVILSEIRWMVGGRRVMPGTNTNSGLSFSHINDDHLPATEVGRAILGGMITEGHPPPDR